MTSVFISYRRSDAAPHAGRLYDRLTARLGDDAVFMDVDDIEGGADFAEVIAATLARSDVLLVVIGRGWADARDATGRRRLDDAADFVRQELVQAIRLNKRVVPLLVGGATMPAAADLPAEMARLSRYNALEMSDARFEADFARLMEVLDPAPVRRPAGADFRRRRGWRIGLALAGVVAVAAAGYWLSPTLRRGGGAASSGVDGNWVATVTYGWGDRYEERFLFVASGSQLTGAAGFLGVARPIVGGTVEGGRIAFATRTQGGFDRHAPELMHGYRGVIEGDTIRFVLVTEGGNAGDPVEFVARRAP